MATRERCLMSENGMDRPRSRPQWLSECHGLLSRAESNDRGSLARCSIRLGMILCENGSRRKVFRDCSLCPLILRASPLLVRRAASGEMEMNAQAPKLEDAENDLKQLMADVTRPWKRLSKPSRG
jgi:hypothetical protein